MWITGHVVDADGQGLPEVVIQVRGGAPGSRDAITNSRGDYVLQDLHPGAYTIRFVRPGYSTVDRVADVRTGFVATINAQLVRLLA